jgi:hypothetical protein
MSEIPTTLQGWYDGGPWKNLQSMESHPWEPHVGAPLDHPVPPPFRRYRIGSIERAPHEMMHLVHAPDEVMFDPWWGIRAPASVLTPEALRAEAVVLTIESTVRTYVGGNPLKDYVWLLHRLSHDRVSLKELQDIADEAAERWSIETIWTELQRKYAIIREKGDVT